MSISSLVFPWPWWSVMVFISFVNLVICALVFIRSLKPRDGVDSKYRIWMRVMGVIFTVVGAYRSVFVSRYHTQYAWFDTLANSSLLIRTFAMLAELAFSGLIALAMLRFNHYLPSKEGVNSNKFISFFTTKSPYVLVISIFLAQFFAFGAIITKIHLLWAIEETLWGIGFVSILPLAIIQLFRAFSIKEEEVKQRMKMLRISAVVIAVWCVIYCSYSVVYHLPGYWVEVINQFQSGPLDAHTGVSAIIDSFMIVNVTRAYSDWGFGFLLWHSAYFSVCVWISIFLMQAPRPLETGKKLNKKLTIVTVTMIAITIITLLTLIILSTLTS